MFRRTVPGMSRQRPVITDPDVDLRQVIAPRLRRLVAFILDTFTLLTIFLILRDLVPREVLSWTLTGLGLANTIVAVAWFGRTFGMEIVGIRVVKARDGSRPGIVTAVVRFAVTNALILVSYAFPGALDGRIITVAWPLICYGPILFDRPLRRGLHDRVARTLVVRARAVSA
jgi:uncharacterized RDD family membrane protein YckC